MFRQLKFSGVVALTCVLVMTGSVFGQTAFTDVTQATGLSAIIEAAHTKFQESVKTGNRWWLSGFDFVDLRGNGTLDLLVNGHGAEAILCSNDGNGHFSYIDPRFDIARGKKANADLPYPGGELRLAYDLDEDGRPDLFSSWGDDAGVFYPNDTKDNVYNFKRAPYLTYFFRQCAVYDVDGDGFADFLCNTGDNGSNNGIRICFGDKDHKFDRQKTIAGENETGYPADITGDGVFSMIVGMGGGYDNNKLGTKVLRFNKDFTATVDVTDSCGLKVDSGYRVKGVMDLNNDGFPDLVCMSKDGERVSAWINDGKGHFTMKPGVFKGMEKAAAPKAYAWGDAVMVDLDNDGIPDIMLNGRSFLWVFHGKGDGTWELCNKQWNIPDFATSAVDEGRCFGDYDQDGMLDLVCCDLKETPGEYDKFRLLHNDLPKKNFIRVRPVGAAGNRAAAGAKISVYQPGGLDNIKKLMFYEQVAIWGHQSGHSYYTASHTERHFGLGDNATCDVSVVFSSGKKVEKKGVAANKIVTIDETSGEVTARDLP